MNPNTILALLLLIFALILSLGFFSCFFRMKIGEMFTFWGGVLALFFIGPLYLWNLLLKFLI